MSLIVTKDLTRSYGHQRGIFDININVEEGEVFGFLGPNGAGKTTTIRHLMGFVRPQKGSCHIFGRDAYHEAGRIHAEVGYLPEELAFMDSLTGYGMLRFMARLKGVHDLTRRDALLERFQLDPRGSIGKMSKGTKQKLGLVIALMGDTSLYILDEPTAGLDPLMQNRFVQFVLEERSRGKTFFMSSHMFEEVERTCDRAAIIRKGELVAVETIEAIRAKRHRTYTVTFATPEDAAQFEPEGFTIKSRRDNVASFAVRGELQRFLYLLSQAKVTDLQMEEDTLETTFLHYYGEEVSS